MEIDLEATNVFQRQSTKYIKHLENVLMLLFIPVARYFFETLTLI